LRRSRRSRRRVAVVDLCRSRPSGLREEHSVDWDEIAAIVEEAFRIMASKKLIAELDE